ncbi:hypothetical protein Bca52824_035982 [Brassica carinata]|uniref:Transducin/WD40 repeat-like superfamily protein n=1 Tax=Brassica carinata TaxID=52824 RepID=A0A8X7S3V9_BRACI|nr:hypothetical protein Bca52824_035982 [Brassica carinata]
METKAEDTSAAQARDGKDIQGIPWERLSLRNFVWVISKHDIYLLSNYSISRWSSLTGSRNEILNVKGHVAPSERHPESLLERFTKTQVSTLAVKERLLVAGGFQGELIFKHLDRPGVSFCSRTTYIENTITNALYGLISGALCFMASNNDCGVRDFDMKRYKLVQLFRYPWPVNHSSLSPDGKLVVVIGDDPNGLLVDSSNRQAIGMLKGHINYSFTSDWYPNGVIFATGNQDKACLIWDTRNLSESVTVLKANLGSVWSIRFTSD